jgi:predicted ester cyclase
MNPSPDTVIRQWFQQVWNETREDAIDALMSPDGKVYGLGGDVIVGPAGFKPFHRALCSALTDFKVEVLQTVAQDDRVAAYCRVTARHSGDGLGGQATGKTVDFYGTTICRVQDGRIAEGWNTFDFLTMYQQLGWVASPVAAA